MDDVSRVKHRQDPQHLRREEGAEDLRHHTLHLEDEGIGEGLQSAVAEEGAGEQTRGRQEEEVRGTAKQTPLSGVGQRGKE